MTKTIFNIKIEQLILLFVIVACINLTANCFSPFFLMEGNYDPVTFYMEGKAWAHGYLPYKDFTDVKGIFLFFIYLTGYIISPDKTWGIFGIYTLFAYIFSVFCYKIAKARNLSDSKALIVTLLILLILYHKDTAFWGAQPELLINMFQIWALYAFVKIQDSPFIEKKDARFAAWSYGLGCAACMLIKYNLIIPYIAFFLLTLIILKQKNAQRTVYISFISHSVTSLFIFCLPFAIYLSYHHLYPDFIHDYFTLNLNAYAGNDGYYNNTPFLGILLKKIKSILLGTEANFALAGITYFTFSLFHSIFTHKNKSHHIIQFLLACSFFLSAAMGHWGYYYLLFVPILIFPIVSIIHRLLPEKLHFIIQFSIIVFLTYSIVHHNNHFMSERGIKRADEMIQAIQTIDKTLSRTTEPKIMYYRTQELGFGLKACALPACPEWFYLPGIPSLQLKQDEAVKQKLADFIYSEIWNESFLRKHGYQPVPGSSYQKNFYLWEKAAL